MKGRKHHGEHHAEHHAMPSKAHHRKHGGALHSPKVEDAGGNPEVEKEAKKTKSVGKIGGVKSTFRGDRKRGGSVKRHEGHHEGHHSKHHADGGAPDGGENPAERKRGGRVHHGKHHDEHGMAKVHHGEGGVAHHHTHAGGHHHSGRHASGGGAGADTHPYSSAHAQLRKGGHC